MNQVSQTADSDAPLRIAVVGGGFSGMAAAEALLLGARRSMFSRNNHSSEAR